MKIALTGDSKDKGLGKFFFETFNKDPLYEVFWFGKDNGFDITEQENIEKILSSISDCDVFINNAYAENGNKSQLLRDVIKAWSRTYKQIINVNSAVIYLPENHEFFDMTGPGVNFKFRENCLEEYNVTHKEIFENEKYPKVLQNTPRVTQYISGLTDSGDPDTDHLCIEKINPKTNTDFLKNLVNMNEKIHTKEIFVDRVQTTPLG